MKRFFHRYAKTLLLHAAVWILLGVAWWNGTSTIVIERQGSSYTVQLNGRQIDQVNDATFSTGGVRVMVDRKNFPFEAPIVPSVRSIKVEDSSGKELFSQHGVMSTGFQNWSGDLRTTVIINGMPNVVIALNEQSNGDAFFVVLRPLFDRDYGTKKVVDGKEKLLTGHTDANIGVAPAMFLLFRLLFVAYPALLVFIGVGFTLRQLRLHVDASLRLFVLRFYRPTIFLLFSSTFLLLLSINYYLLEGIPHVPDSVVYLMQAKIFASGRLFASPLIFPRFYDFFDSLSGGMIYRDGKWFSQYPFGHPLVLTLGILIGHPWIIPPMVGTICAILLYFLAKTFYGKWIAFLVVVAMVMSPFFQSNASNFMSHNTAMLYLLGFLFFFFRILRSRSMSDAFFGALFWGLLFNTRILTAISIAIPFGIAALFAHLPWRVYLSWFVGGSIMIGLYVGYNAVLTGNPLTNPYQLSVTPPLGFYPGHSVGVALVDTLTNFSYFLTFSLGWPQWLTMSAVLFTLLVSPVRKRDVLFAISMISIMTSWFWFNGSFVMYGPRYYYEMMPFLLLLTGSGIEKFVRFVHHHTLARLIVTMFIMVLSARVLWSWVFHGPRLWNLPNTPSSVWDLKGFNFTNGKLFKEAQRLHIRHAVVFTTPCPHWWCDGVPFSSNSPNFDTDIIWAKDLGARNKELMDRFPDRVFYLANYESGTIRRYEESGMK